MSSKFFANHRLDLGIETYCRNRASERDKERFEYLFRLYEEMTSKERKK